MRSRLRNILGVKFLLALATALIVFIAVTQQRDWISGSWYWRWRWRDVGAISFARFYFAMMLAAVPMIVAWFVPDRTRRHRIFALALISISVIAMKVTTLAILTKPMSFAALDAIVQSPDAMSYYVDAEIISRGMPRGWLASYPQILAHGGMHLHTLSKPPGAVGYFFVWIRALGFGQRSAIASGIGLGFLASLSIPAIYFFLRVLTGKHRAAIVAASLLALCPGFILIFPTFDACYPILTCALIASWHRAMTRNDSRCAILFGATLFATCFVTYNLLVLGAFLAAWSFLARGHAKPLQLARLTLVAISTCIVISLALWLVTGFDQIATFRAAYHNQQTLLAAHPSDRPYPWTILFDLLDFSLGAGWVIVVLVGFSITHRLLRDRGCKDSESMLVLLCIAQPILVAILGILQSEAARAWNFMLPLLILPASIELARWPRSARIAIYFAMLFVLIAVGHNMIFLVP